MLRLPSPKAQFFDSNGDPLNGGLVYTYAAGTTTAQATYTTQAGGTANANPVVLDSRGEADIWYDSSLSYKVVLKTSAGVTLWTVDNFSSGAVTIPWAAAGGTANAITVSYVPANATLADGTILGFRAAGANTSTTPTFSPDGLTARTIVKVGGTALVAGDIPAQNAEMLVRYNLANTRWELLNPAFGGITATNEVTVNQLINLNKHAADVACSATLNLDAVEGDLVDITGSTGPVTAITLADGVAKTCRFVSTPTLTHGASLILPGSANITTEAGDVMIFRGYAAGVVRCIMYQQFSLGVARSLQLMTETSATGTAVDFTGFPSWAKRVSVLFSAVGHAATSQPYTVQLGGTGTSFEGTGYISMYLEFPGATLGTSTTGLVASPNLIGTGGTAGISSRASGIMDLHLLSTTNNTWVSKSHLMDEVANSAVGVTWGKKSLPSALGRLRVTSTSGTATFTTGSINVSYE